MEKGKIESLLVYLAVIIFFELLSDLFVSMIILYQCFKLETIKNVNNSPITSIFIKHQLQLMHLISRAFSLLIESYLLKIFLKTFSIFVYNILEICLPKKAKRNFNLLIRKLYLLKNLQPSLFPKLILWLNLSMRTSNSLIFLKVKPSSVFNTNLTTT